MKPDFSRNPEPLRKLALPLALLLIGSALTRRGHPQDYMFSTLAGSGGPGAIDGPAASARFNYPGGVAVDNKGNLYVADSLNATIRKIAPDGAVTTLAGLATALGAGNGLGGGARFTYPTSLIADTAGNVFVADTYNHTIRKITPGGVVTTFAGSAGRSGPEDGTGDAARFSFPNGLAIDTAGHLYVADTLNHAIRRITLAGEVITLAGSAEGSGSDDGTGQAARFNFPNGVAVDKNGILYVADSQNQTIRRISAEGVVSTFAGAAGENGSADGTGTAARFYNPTGVACDPVGNVYVADNANSILRKITPEGVVTTLAGDPTQPDLTLRPFISFNDGLGNIARFKYPNAVAVDGTGTLYVADSGNDAIRRVTPGGLVTTVAGSSQPGTNDGPGTLARFSHPTGVTVDKTGAVFVVDGYNNTIRQVSPTRSVTTLAGQPGVIGSKDGIGAAAQFDGPRKLAINSGGHLLIADTGNDTLRKMARIEASGAWEVSTFAGVAGSSGNNEGTGSEARFNSLYDVAVDRNDNLYVADKDNQIVRKVTPAGVVTTFAGTVGVAGAADGPRETAQFKVPYGIAVDREDNVYVADTLNHTIRKITVDGLVSTLAGEADTPGSEDGLGNQARFNAPYGIAVDGANNVYVADFSNNLIRKISPAGEVTTLGGRVQPDPEGYPLLGSADGQGSFARFYNPKGIAVDNAGTIYLADSFNNAIRIGTTNFCADQATIDLATAQVGQPRQLDATLQTAVAWEWSLIRRPANSLAALSAANVRNPIFTPDVADLFVFQLRATNAVGASCIRTVSLAATLAPPNILAPSLVLHDGKFDFTFQGLIGTSVRIQLSPDLSNWITIGTITNQTGTGSFSDPFRDPQRRFYRLQQF